MSGGRPAAPHSGARTCSQRPWGRGRGVTPPEALRPAVGAPSGSADRRAELSVLLSSASETRGIC